MKKWMVVLTVAVALFGCAASRGHWAKDAPEERIKIETDHCEQDAEMACQGENDSVFNAICNETTFKRCMEAHGFRWVKD